ncbi:hypothetical protein [Sphingomonas hylomeconis]|uniref:Uncharacterized protein n=1 Tax=Sphingomonas hylomeconis TaxID=1395958 RepID=A0ABV7SRV1_9SPHN|nr:hypothetical protein [Sphingomonas hylomeconis]
MKITAVILRGSTPGSVEELPVAEAFERFSAGLQDPATFVDVAGVRVEGVLEPRAGRFSLRRHDEFYTVLALPEPRALMVDDGTGTLVRIMPA